MGWSGLVLIIILLLSFTNEYFFFGAKLGVGIFILIAILDFYFLFRGEVIQAERKMADRFSNGDDNEVRISIENKGVQNLSLEIIDELPFIFQRRDVQWELKINAKESKSLIYHIRPVKRGEYAFGSLNIFVQTFFGFWKRRYRFSVEKKVAVYPSFLQLRKYELAAFARKNFDLGVKKMRRIGTTMEFEQIKEYVQGDDPRFINWRATARSGEMMVNQFQDQKSQHIISMIDKGRLMKMPFVNMTLLDYAINATLVISNIAIKKGDKAGVISYSNKISGIVMPEKRRNQMFKIQEFLYSQLTNYKESDTSLLQRFVRSSVKQRSLLLHFTNFESLNGMRRQLPYFRQLNKKHVLVVIFFRNTELKELMEKKAETEREVFTQVIAEKQHYEKSQIVKELRMNGIYAVLTTPQNLTLDTINKYLEIKARGVL